MVSKMSMSPIRPSPRPPLVYMAPKNIEPLDIVAMLLPQSSPPQPRPRERPWYRLLLRRPLARIMPEIGGGPWAPAGSGTTPSDPASPSDPATLRCSHPPSGGLAWVH